MNSAIPAPQTDAPSRRAVRRIAFIGFEGFQLLDIAGPVEVFSKANLHMPEIAAQPFRYELVIASPHGGMITSSSGLPIAGTLPWRELDADIDTILVSGGPEPALRAVAAETLAKIVWYDTEALDGWCARDVVYGETTRLTLVAPDGGKLALRTGLLGEHNIENIVGVSAYLLERGLVSEQALAAAVASFGGIRRRLDRLTTSSQVPVMSLRAANAERAGCAPFGPFTFRARPSGKYTSVKKHRCGSLRDCEPSMRTSVPAFSIAGVMPLRLSCVKPCDSQMYSCDRPFSSTAMTCR